MRRKVRKYLGVTPPTDDDLQRLRREHAGEIELRAALKRAELRAGGFAPRYLTPVQTRRLEELRYLHRAVQEHLTPVEVEALATDFEIRYVQGTTAIEGNTLTLGETTELLLHGIAPARRSLREINEVQNYRKVALYRAHYRGRVTLAFIRRLHALIMDNIDLYAAGEFRRLDNLGITGVDAQLTPSLLITEELTEQLEGYYHGLAQRQHPFELAVLFHYHFEMIHPFTDGNGRVGREVLNYMLAERGYPRLLVTGSERGRYIDALGLGNRARYAGMVSSFVDLYEGQRRQSLLETLAQATQG